MAVKSRLLEELLSEEYEFELPVSMIDVVFLLLIFFLCSSSMARPEKSLPSRLPRAGPAARPRVDELDAVRIRLFFAGGTVRTTCDGQSCDAPGELLAMLRARRRLGQPPVIIEGQPDVPFGYMVAALDACRQAGLSRAAFSDKGTDQ